MTKKQQEIENAIKKSDEIPVNLFTILGLETKEVIHSRFLAYLLSPTGIYISGGDESNKINVGHKFGTKFLKKFIELCGIKKELNNRDVENAKVYIEYPVKNKRRIDILIKIGDYWIGIENKIYAGDQKNQLKDYYEFLKNKTKDKFRLIFLTLDGREASKYSTVNKSTKYIPISYDIIDKLLQVDQNNKIVKEYKSILEILTRDYRIVEKLWLENNGDWDWDYIKKALEKGGKKKDWIMYFLKTYIYPENISYIVEGRKNYYQENNTFYIWKKKTEEAEYDIYFEFDETVNKVFYYPIKITSQNKWFWGDKNNTNQWKSWATRRTCWNCADGGILVEKFDIESDNIKAHIEEMASFIKNNP